MKKIELYGKYGGCVYTIVDDEDYEWLSKYKWYAARYPNTDIMYARRYDKGIIMMHREIMSATEGYVVDHINGNGLDNQKTNLRICTQRENKMNRIKHNNKTTSKYKGVYYEKLGQRWRASIQKDGKTLDRKSFKTEKEAALYYNELALKYFGEYAKLNIVE